MKEVSDNLEVKGNLFCEEELGKALKQLGKTHKYLSNKRVMLTPAVYPCNLTKHFENYRFHCSSTSQGDLLVMF